MSGTHTALPAEIAQTRPCRPAILRAHFEASFEAFPHSQLSFSFRLITKGDAPGFSPESSAFLSVGWNWGSFGCEPRLLHEDRNRSCSFQR